MLRLFTWLKTTGHRVYVGAFDEGEDGQVTVRVGVSGDFNLVAMERTVFGIDPDDLEECELPKDGELVGDAGFSPEEVRQLI